MEQVNDSGTHSPKPDKEELTDEQLLKSVGAGDLAAFECLYKRYYEYLHRFIYRTTRRLELVEEIINDVMLVVWQRAATLELTVKPSTWILAVAYKKALKALRLTHNRSDTVPLEDLPEGWLSDQGPGMAELETANWVAAAFDLLSPEQRAVMELTYHYGMHYTEIAVAVGCPENTVKTRIFYARKRLKAALPQLGGE